MLFYFSHDLNKLYWNFIRTCIYQMFFLFCRSPVHFRKNCSIRHTDQTITGHVWYQATEIFMWSMHQEIQNNWRLAKTSKERTRLGFFGGSHKQFIQEGSHCTIPGLVHEMFSAFAGHKWRIQDGWRRENSKKFKVPNAFISHWQPC